jgi:phosphate/sulfate permease
MRSAAIVLSAAVSVGYVGITNGTFTTANAEGTAFSSKDANTWQATGAFIASAQ